MLGFTPGIGEGGTRWSFCSDGRVKISVWPSFWDGLATKRDGVGWGDGRVEIEQNETVNALMLWRSHGSLVSEGVDSVGKALDREVSESVVICHTRIASSRP